MGRDVRAELIASVQERVPEPITHVGLLQPAGTWGAVGVTHLSGVAGMVMRKAANQRAGGLSEDRVFARLKMALVAVTEHRVHAFSARPRGRSWKVGDEVGSWDRSDLRVATTPAKLSVKVVIDVASTGDHYELEATTIGSLGFHQDFLTEIATAA